MKLYTRTGDDGSTSLFGGQRVAKDALRVQAYGTVDELNSFIGLAAVLAAGTTKERLHVIQARLFEIGSDLATPRTSDDDPGPAHIPRLNDDEIAELERWIDDAHDHLPEMRNFILPGGSELAARLHVARTVCRRAERVTYTLAQEASIGGNVLQYLNRLSDLLFAMARHANHDNGVEDVPWIAPS
ncbi:MAG: cob(I)yrinic acid a,c-diamide adenosyltransferase [Planctomycetota bacterium]